MDAREVAERLGLEPHPEGGWFRETWRGPEGPGGRSAGTAIYYLLDTGEASAWHRIDADEAWHFYAGDPLEHVILSPDGDERRAVLGPDLAAGQRPQRIVPAGAWQRARALGGWSLVGCTVAPGFSFEGFELGPPDLAAGAPGA